VGSKRGSASLETRLKERNGAVTFGSIMGLSSTRRKVFVRERRHLKGTVLLERIEGLHRGKNQPKGGGRRQRRKGLARGENN